MNLKQILGMSQPDWRENLLNQLLVGFLIIVTPIVIFGLIYRPEGNWTIPSICLALGLILLALKGRHFTPRATLFCGILFAMGLLSLMFTGVEGGGRLFFGAAIIVGRVFFDVRVAVAILLAAAASIVGTGYFGTHLSGDVFDWGIYLAGFLLIWGLMLVATSTLLRETESANEALKVRIEEEKAREEKVRQDLQRLEFITANTTDAIWMMDLDLNYTYISPVIENIRGYTSEEVLELGDANFASGAKEFLSAVVEQRLELDEGEERDNPLILETQMQHKKGHVVDIEVTARFVRDDHGQPISMLGATRNVTDRKQLERAMKTVIQGTQRSEGADYLDSLTHNLSEALEVRYVMIGEMDGDSVATLSVFSDDAHQDNYRYEYLHAPCAEVIKSKSVHMYPGGGADDSATREILAELGMHSYLGTPLVGINGDVIGILVAMHHSPIEKVDFCIDMLNAFAVHASAELTRRKSEADREDIRYQLMQSQKLDSMGQLAGGIAHDFNNLLVVIRGANFMAQKMANNPDLDHYFDQIQESTDRATKLTRQILSFSRRQILETRTVSPNALLKDLNQMLSRLLPENIRLTFLPDETASAIKVDPSQIEQVVMNVAINARDAMPDGGAIEISTKNVHVDEEFVEKHSYATSDDFVELSIRDTGVGMPPDILDRIFDPFFTTKPEGQGTGLGLAVAFGIIKQHGGFVQVESEPDVGTTVKVYLPAVLDEVVVIASVSKNDITESYGENTVLLLVEDEVQVRQLAKEFLESVGYQVVDCPDGSSAIASFEAHRDEISMALIDVVLPDMNGRRVMDSIHAINPNLPILFMTGHTEGGIHEDFVLNPEIELLRKPYQPEELLSRVHVLLAHADAMDSGAQSTS